MQKYESDTLEEAYFDRNQAFLALAKIAQEKGYLCGIGQDKDPNWPFVFINLPTGQVSSHIHRDEIKKIDWLRRHNDNRMWDGTGLTEKRLRMNAFFSSKKISIWSRFIWLLKRTFCRHKWSGWRIDLALRNCCPWTSGRTHTCVKCGITKIQR